MAQSDMYLSAQPEEAVISGQQNRQTVNTLSGCKIPTHSSPSKHLCMGYKLSNHNTSTSTSNDFWIRTTNTVYQSIILRFTTMITTLEVMIGVHMGIIWRLVRQLLKIFASGMKKKCGTQPLRFKFNG